MDLSYYLSEILEQQGEVNVPGLGYFAKVRVNAYYDEEEEKFYPPRNEVKFDPKAVNEDDETLANYIAGKKDISITSSKFFVSQYNTSLLQDAAIKDIAIGELGWLSFEKSNLVFKSKINDPAYFGLPALQVHKIGSKPAASEPIPELSLTIASSEPEHHQPQTTETETEAEQNGYFEEEEEYEERRGLNVKLIAMIVGGILVVATAGLYLYDPSLFGVAEKRKPLVTTTATQTPVNADTTAKTAATVTDTTVLSAPVTTDTNTQAAVTQKPAAPVNLDLDAPVQQTVIDQEVKAATAESVDQLPWHPTHAIVGGTFPKREFAQDAVDEFKARGISAQVIQDNKSKKMLVLMGTYQTGAEARSALKEMKKARKARKDFYIKVFN